MISFAPSSVDLIFSAACAVLVVEFAVRRQHRGYNNRRETAVEKDQIQEHRL